MSRFNLRKRPHVDYYEPAQPSLDEYICKYLSYNAINFNTTI